MAQNAGSINTAADFFSRLELKVTHMIRVKIPEDIKPTPIDLTTYSLDVADEQQFFIIQAHNKDKSVEQTLEQKNNLDKMLSNG